MPATIHLMEDGCILLDSKQCTINALIHAILTGRVATDKVAQKLEK